MKMIVPGVPSTWANYAIVSVPNDSGKLNATGLWNFALSCPNVGATLRVIGNWGISATPALDDSRLLGSKTSLKRAKNVGVACNLRADIQHFMLVGLHSWHGRAANITQKWCCTRRTAAGGIATSGAQTCWDCHAKHSAPKAGSHEKHLLQFQERLQKAWAKAVYIPECLRKPDGSWERRRWSGSLLNCPVPFCWVHAESSWVTSCRQMAFSQSWSGKDIECYPRGNLLPTMTHPRGKANCFKDFRCVLDIQYTKMPK